MILKFRIIFIYKTGMILFTLLYKQDHGCRPCSSVEHCLYHQCLLNVRCTVRRITAAGAGEPDSTPG